MSKILMEIGKIICFLWFITSCTTNDFHRIELQIETDETDVVQVFWNTTYIDNYTEENSIKLSAEKGDNHLTYDLPNNKDIKALRIDLGDKITTRNILLHSVIIHSNNQVKVIKDHSMSLYFEGNHEVMYDSVQKAFRLKNDIAEDPYIITKNLDKLF